MTKEDLRKLTQYCDHTCLTTDELPEYKITYLGHVAVDEITACVPRIRPKEIKKNKPYFQGKVWVYDHHLQIVKSNGKQVPPPPGQENFCFRDLPPGKSTSRWRASFPHLHDGGITRFTSPNAAPSPA